MKTETMQNWQIRRSNFNHGWLKNRFLTILDSVDNVLSGRARGEAYLDYVFRHDLPEWESQRKEITQLLGDFESAMSPKNLINSPPLIFANSTIKQCLAIVAHQLWLGRYPVNIWLRTAKNAVNEVNDAYDHLRTFNWSFESRTSNADFIVAFADFRGKCTRLAKAVEQFPDRILTV